MAGPQVLIVEDEFLIRLTLAEALTDAGFSVLEAETAQDAITALQANPQTAVMLTDVQLPGGVNGLELARTVRALSPNLPVIYMTGRPDSLADIQRSPRDAIISKPYLPSEVCETVRRMTTA